MTEKRLLERIVAGDSRALAEIIKTYSTYVRTIAANITIPPLQQEDVEEVASDAFLAVWNHAAEIEDGKLKSYLAAVTRNLAKNKLRYLHLSVPLEEEYMILTVPDVEEELLEKDIRRLTRQAVDNLPEPDRSIFMRYYFLYQKTDEIAAALELNSAAVRQRLSRGREKLKRNEQLLKFFAIVFSTAGAIDSYLQNNFIGSYDIMKLYITRERPYEAITASSVLRAKEFKKYLGEHGLPTIDVDYYTKLVNYCDIGIDQGNCIYCARTCIREINEQLKNQGITLLRDGRERRFNKFDFNKIVKQKQWRADHEYCQRNPLNICQNEYLYSAKAVKEIIQMVAANPEDYNN